MFEPEEVETDLDCLPVLQVKGLFSYFHGYLIFRIVHMLDDASLKYGAQWLCEVNHLINWQFVLHATDNNGISKLAEPLVLDLLESRQKS